MSAYEKAHAWRELFALASKQKVQGSELEDICDRVSGKFIESLKMAGLALMLRRVPIAT